MKVEQAPYWVGDGKFLLSLTDAMHFLSVSKEQLEGLVDSGNFPSPIQLNEGIVRWRVDHVMDWAMTRPLYGDDKDIEEDTI